MASYAERVLSAGLIAGLKCNNCQMVFRVHSSLESCKARYEAHERVCDKRPQRLQGGTTSGSNGSMENNQAQSLAVTEEGLKDILECPVCLQVPRQPPIYQCELGHCICSVCHAKLTNCPVCRVPIGKTRSLVSEKIVSRMPHSCKFSNYGCNLEHTKTQLEEHEKDCKYRLVNCVDLDCQTQVPLAQLLEHIKKDHEKEDFARTAKCTKHQIHFNLLPWVFTEETICTPDHIEFEGRHFFRECFRSENGQWFVWVYMIGSRK